MRTDKSLAILASLGSAAAFWRMECRGRVGLARLDPLIDPGVPSKHSHAIHGSNGFSESCSFDDLHNAPCTSCAVNEDMSAYWPPNIYFKHADGKYEEVKQEGGMLAYYFLNHDGKDPKKPITAFPNGFSMVAGDSARRNYSVGGLDYREPDPEKAHWAKLGQTNQHDLRQRALGFNCLNYGVNKDEPTLGRHYLPEKDFLDGNCKHGVRFELSFPSCWNGKDITAPDHQSHVAYPSLVLNGDCPDGFDVKLPGLMYETIWRTQDFVGVAGEFVVSNGDPQGFGYHGDFISGWDEKFLQAAVDQCTNPSGNIADCPLFTIQSLEDQLKCKIAPPPMVASEKLTGVIGNTLPGGVTIQRGPGPAVHNGAPPAAAPASSVETGNQHAAMAGENKLPGGVFKEAPTSSTEVPPSPTAAPIPSDPPVPEGYELVRTDYVTNGGVVSKIIVIETVTYVMLASETVTVTATVPAAEKRHAHQHLARHRRGSL